MFRLAYYLLLVGTALDTFLDGGCLAMRDLVVLP
jgi:hypothetical protein